MFPDREQSFNELKHLMEKVTAVVSLTRVWIVHGRPHNAHPTAEINKVKYLALLYLVSIFISSRLHLLSKNILTKHFFYVYFNEMFIVDSKSHCCNDTFTDVRFTSLLANWLLFLRVMQENKSGCFFSEHSVECGIQQTCEI